MIFIWSPGQKTSKVRLILAGTILGKACYMIGIAFNIITAERRRVPEN